MKTAISLLLLHLVFSGCHSPVVKKSSPAKNDTPLISGRNNIWWGKNSAPNITTGDYNFCFGDGSCPDLTTQDCVVDIRPLSDEIRTEIAKSSPLDQKEDGTIEIRIRLLSDSQVGQRLAEDELMDTPFVDEILAAQDNHCGAVHSQRIRVGLKKLEKEKR